jgi:hypothetical protein
MAIGTTVVSKIVGIVVRQKKTNINKERIGAYSMSRGKQEHPSLYV